MKIRSNKINFFKKIWYSITKIDKYEELRQEGISASISYFINSIIIICAILAIISTFVHVKLIKTEINYIDSKLPELSFKDNKLTVDGEEPVILDSEDFKKHFGTVVVINPSIDQQKAVDEYYKITSKENTALVFLNDKFLIISNKYNPENNSQDGIEQHIYSEEILKYFKEQKEEYSKKDIIQYLESGISEATLLIQYLVTFIITFGLLYLFYIALISLVLWGMTKLLKLKWGYKNTLMNTIYSSTLSWIVFALYILLGYITKISIPFFDVVNIVLIFIYITLLLYRDRNKIKEAKSQK